MTGNTAKQEGHDGGPAIILVEPQLGENIGTAARAMANFGLADLRLVKPRDGWPNDKATRGGEPGRPVIDAAQVFDDLRSGDRRPQFRLSRRRRASATASSRCAAPREAARTLRARSAGRAGDRHPVRPRALGARPTRRSRSPTRSSPFRSIPAFASLNIAQAVLLMSYEWMKSGLESRDGHGLSGPRHDARAEGASAGPVRASRGGAGCARLFPAAGEEAEHGRQPARRADARRPSPRPRSRCCAASLPRSTISRRRSRAAPGYPERKVEADRRSADDRQTIAGERAPARVTHD